MKRRIIPCLDIKDGRTVKGVNFIDIRDAGDPVELAAKYSREGADELVFLDITATEQKRKTLCDLVRRISEQINIPFTVGGGINSLEDAAAVINSGADKVSLNSAAVKSPQLISSIAQRYGSQCVVVAIDTKFIDDQWKVFVNGGKISTGMLSLDWAKEAERCGAGELLLTSMNSDGTKSGYSTNITKVISESVSIPVIASGGAGTMEHFKEVFQNTRASGALAASIFHYNEVQITELKNYLKNQNIPVR